MQTIFANGIWFPCFQLAIWIWPWSIALGKWQHTPQVHFSAGLSCHRCKGFPEHRATGAMGAMAYFTCDADAPWRK